MVNRLPTIRFKGKEYFIDRRLKEFRSVEPPIEFVPFRSRKGWEIMNSVFDLPTIMSSSG